MATICTREFEGLGRGQTKLIGMPDLPLVVVPHPVGGQPKATVEGFADEIVERVAAIVVEQPVRPSAT